MNQTKLLSVCASLALAFVMIGCTSPTKATGGGQIEAFDSYPISGGSFGFNGDSCEGSVTGQFNYVDHSVRIDGGVKLHGQVTDAYLCDDATLGCDNCATGEVVITADYRSTNPTFRGEGTVTVCLSDGGEGKGATDTAGLSINGGPFDGYSVAGVVSGNVQEHGCDEDDSL
ncbi:MAG: hypothetical protein Tsb0020_52070 [Haliangiales bacterium]